MSGGFSFPPPPPPPPKPSQDQHPNYGAHTRGQGRGRGDPRGGHYQRGRGSRSGRGGRDFTNDLGQSTHTRAGSNQTYPHRGNSHHSSSKDNTHSLQRNSSDQIYGNARGSLSSASPPRTLAGHKRKLEALRPPQTERSKRPGPETAPAIPDFGAPVVLPQSSLPTKSPTAAESKTAPYKPMGKALGLVPRSENDENYSSDSENGSDVDEEAMHAEFGSQLTFEHNGVFLSLKSQADLVAWKKERQKNWPTTDRVAEKNAERWRIGQERRRLLAAARVLRPPPQYSGRTRRSRGTGQRQTASQKFAAIEHGPERTSTPIDDIGNVQSREEHLAELRRRVAESEVKNREAMEKDSGQQSLLSNQQITSGALKTEEMEKESYSSATGKQAEDPTNNDLGLKHFDDEEKNVNDTKDSEDSLSDSSSQVSSESLSDSDSEDSAPEEESSKAAPLRGDHHDRPLCNFYSEKGWCVYGSSCRYRHEPNAERTIASTQRPKLTQEEKDERRKARAAQEGTKSATTSIFQRLLDQEDDEADKLALQVVKHLGKVGLFSEKSSGLEV